MPVSPFTRLDLGRCAISDVTTAAGLGIERLDTGYMRGPKPMTLMYEGCARPG